jgi:sortase (surface protein transpeptidase)
VTRRPSSASWRRSRTFTIDSWDPATRSRSPTIDLYDTSRNERAFWQPHGTGPAWYEQTQGPWGFPVWLPTQDLPPGSYRLCVQAWRSADVLADLPHQPDRTWGDAPNLQAMGDSFVRPAERLCVAISLVADPAITPPTAEELAAAPQLEIERLGLRTAILPATGINLSETVGLIDGTPRPGDPGTSVIVGHRTTWGADFLDLDQLRPGDRFAVIDGQRRVGLEVVASRVVTADGEATGPTWGIPATELAQPGSVGQPDARVRLVTFNPKYSAAERLVVDAVVTGRFG